MQTSRYVAFAPALAWLVEGSDIGEAAAEAASRPGEAFADAVLADPGRLLDFYRALVLESLAPGTPAGVTEQLIRVVRHVGARSAESSATRDALLQVTASFAGLRDRDELVPALHSAADKVTDRPTRERVLELARYISPELTVKKRGPFGQVVVDVVTPTEPDPPPRGPVHPKRPPDEGTGEPVVPLIDESSPGADLLDQISTAGTDAAVEWAESDGFSADEAGPYGAVYATEIALEIIYEGDLGNGFVAADRCLLADVLSRVGERIGGAQGHAMGFAFGSAACDAPTPHAVHSAILSTFSAVLHQHVSEIDLATGVIASLGDSCVPCVIAHQILSR